MTAAYTRPGATVVDYNSVTGDSITSQAQKHDDALNDLYTQIIIGTTSLPGVLQLGTGAGNAALGNHAHSGTYQPADATLTAVAAVYTAADKIPYATAADTLAEATFTAAGRAILDDATASDQLTTLGLSTFIKTLVDDADAATARGTLGLGDASTHAASDFQTADTHTMKDNVAVAKTKQHYATPLAVTSSSGALAIDMDTCEECTITLSENTTVGAPSNRSAGKYMVLHVTGASTYTLAFNGVFKARADLALPAAPAAGKILSICFRCIDSTNLQLIGYLTGV